jgi:hypothetical protein
MNFIIRANKGGLAPRWNALVMLFVLLFVVGKCAARSTLFGESLQKSRLLSYDEYKFLQHMFASSNANAAVCVEQLIELMRSGKLTADCFYRDKEFLEDTLLHLIAKHASYDFLKKLTQNMEALSYPYFSRAHFVRGNSLLSRESKKPKDCVPQQSRCWHLLDTWHNRLTYKEDASRDASPAPGGQCCNDTDCVIM